MKRLQALVLFLLVSTLCFSQQEKFGIHLKLNLEENNLIFSQAEINPKTLTKKQ